MGRFVLSSNTSGWHFELQAGNHEPILHSEKYESKQAAENGIESVKKNSEREGAFEMKESSNGKHYFVLKATNGQVVGQSEMYESAAGAKNGVASVQKNAADAEVVEA